MSLTYLGDCDLWLEGGALMERGPVSDDKRLFIARELAATIRRQEALLWEWAVAEHAGGMSAERLADALGIGLSTFYRRLGHTTD